MQITVVICIFCSGDIPFYHNRSTENVPKKTLVHAPAPDRYAVFLQYDQRLAPAAVLIDLKSIAACLRSFLLQEKQSDVISEKRKQ